MRVIDVDSHFLEPPDWLNEVDPELARELPSSDPIDRVVRGVVGDLLDTIPREQRPEDPLDFLAPSGRRALAAMLEMNRSGEMEPAEDPLRHYEAAARLHFCDEHGIDIQFLNPTLGAGPYVTAKKLGRPDLARRSLEAFNRWSAETLSGHTDRLFPVALIDVGDVDWAVREITRMRRAGSRAFQVRAEPAAPDRSLAHPALDPLWSAAQDLGMAAVLHIGGVRGELKHGWWFNGGDASNYAILQLVNTGTAPQIALAALLIEGVFERHPGLVVLVEELGISWLPHFLETIDSVTVGRYGEQFGMGAGDYRLPLRPSEYMRRQVRVSPLVSADRLRPTLDLLPPELLVFSSDYPHQEGRSQAVKLFDQELGELDASRREQFFSASIAELMDL